MTRKIIVEVMNFCHGFNFMSYSLFCENKTIFLVKMAYFFRADNGSYPKYRWIVLQAYYNIFQKCCPKMSTSNFSKKKKI